jgi:hypothetical protein
MSVQTEAPVTTVLATPAVRESTLADTDGIIAGLLGAAVTALWFLIIDAINGRPLFTPTLLGTALFHAATGLRALETLPVSLEMVVLYTAVHGVVFAAIGSLSSRLLAVAQRQPEVGFGILLLFVVFEFAVTVSPILFAPAVVRTLTWPVLLFANVLATAVMAGYLWQCHPGLRIAP